MTMKQPWVIACLTDVGAVDRDLARLVERFVLSVEVEAAGLLASSIELKVAPPRGGLGTSASGIVEAVTASLSIMAPAVRSCAVSLLSQIAGSLLHADPRVENDMVAMLVAALPGIAAAAQRGDAELQAEFVDFAALCAALDNSVASRVAFYLRRVVADVGGDIGASAQAELEQLGFS
jgi:hypothetical protein